MANDLPVPDLLNCLALAGDRGVPLWDNPEMVRDLELSLSWGFHIQVREGMMYLPRDSDTLVPAWIESEVQRVCWDRIEVAGFLDAGSTNDIGLQRARDGASPGVVIYAERQTEGRGRKGRRWESRLGEGLYFSLVVRPTVTPDRWPILALTAGVALVQAVQETLAIEGGPNCPAAELKWPNDLIVSGKKVAGILVETARCEESAAAAVVGVGLNVGSGSVPEWLRDHATSLSDEVGVRVSRRRLLVRFLFFMQQGLVLFERGLYLEILDLWKSRSSMWNEVPVWLIEGERSRPAVTCGLTEQGALVVRNADGKEETLLAGDVSIRSQDWKGLES